MTGGGGDDRDDGMGVGGGDAHAGGQSAVAWMARNSVAANILMLSLLIGGAFMATRTKQEVFPEFELDAVNIAVPYPGASPAEVEQGVVLAVEEAVRGVDGVKRVTALANEGSASVRVELETGTDSDRALNDLKSAVDRITSLPVEAERPVISVASNRREVVSLVVYGKVEEAVLRSVAERMRTELLLDPKVTQAELDAVRRMELAIEVDQATLRQHGLTLEAVASAIRRGAVELPAGAIRTSSGEVLVRTSERRSEGREFADIPVLQRPDGGALRLGDIAKIRDGFEDSDQAVTFNGAPAARVRVFRVGAETPIEVSEAVHAYLARAKSTLPQGVSLSVWRDDSETYRDRLDLLIRNAQSGLILVILVLGLFLEARIAFWVTMGIPTSFLGAMVFLPMFGVSFNMVSLFAFIIVLGMVVDDAIVVGENVHHLRQRGVPRMRAAIRGAGEVSMPVVFSVLTTVAAFLPLLFIPGYMGKIWRVIPLVVISVLLVSVMESMFVLPSHLGELRQMRTKGLIGFFNIQQQAFADAMQRNVNRAYVPLVRSLLRWRYLSVAVSIALLIVSYGVVEGGGVQFIPFPRVESDVVSANVALPFGAPIARSIAAREQLVAAAQRVIARHGGDRMQRGLFATVGTPAESGRGGGASGNGSHLASAQVFLVPSDQRDFSAETFAAEWREEAGAIVGAELARFSALGGPSSGPAIDVELTHPDLAALEKAAADLAQRLRNFAGVKDVDDGFSAGKPQYDVKLRPAGVAAGLSAQDLARTLRASYFGVEALRQQRAREEIRVVVRLDEAARRREFDLERLIIRSPTGVEIALGDAAELRRGNAYTQIRRVDGRRSVSVNADVQPGVGDLALVMASLTASVLPELASQHAGLSYDFGGQRREFYESLAALGRGFLVALLLIYVLLAIPFRSYVQPLVVMTAIPFGIVGALAGHLLMGIELSTISLMGVVALAGVVVNDSLVLVDAANAQRTEGSSHFEAIAWAGARRFRPILLTSLTTFFGLAPMIFETSVQARFLIPMAISLGFGILFSTVIVLAIVPCFYLIVEDIRGIYTGVSVHEPSAPPPAGGSDGAAPPDRGPAAS